MKAFGVSILLLLAAASANAGSEISYGPVQPVAPTDDLCSSWWERLFRMCLPAGSQNFEIASVNPVQGNATADDAVEVIVNYQTVDSAEKQQVHFMVRKSDLPTAAQATTLSAENFIKLVSVELKN